MSSSFSITAFFALKKHDHCCTNIAWPDGTTASTFHVYYQSDLLCGQNSSMPAVICKYSAFKETVFANNTVVFVVAKAHVPPPDCPSPILLEASNITALLGNPAD
jgi:hypothetical protein